MTTRKSQTVLLRGGMDLVSPPSVVKPGFCVFACNYEPEVAGYRRMQGYDRFDGQALSVNVFAVPGTGDVLGVWVYAGAVWSIRKTAGENLLYKGTLAGWALQSFGHTIEFTGGSTSFTEGEVITGGTSGATATVRRVIDHIGTYADLDAAGYLVVDTITGTFNASEVITGSLGGAASTGSSQVAITIGNGNGPFQFVNHNFYGAAGSERMYFCGGPATTGSGIAYEWDGTTLSPVNLIDDVDGASFIGVYRNHLILGCGSSVVSSGVGEPLDYRASAGATEFAFGATINGFAPSLSTAFVIFAKDRISYLTGDDSDNFQLLPITSEAGAYLGSIVSHGESPIYMDDAGIRKMTSTAAFGDFRMGTLSQLIEPLFRKKRAEGVVPVAAAMIRSKDQYRIFFDDKSGVIIYLGRKEPECMYFKLPHQITCFCAGEMDVSSGTRYFAGCTDGFVREFEKTNRYDGNFVDAFIQTGWTALGAPNNYKRLHDITVEMDIPTAVLSSGYEIATYPIYDYNMNSKTGVGGVNHDLPVGSQSFVEYDTMLQSGVLNDVVQSILHTSVDAFFRRMALILWVQDTNDEPNTLSSVTINYSLRGQVRGSGVW